MRCRRNSNWPKPCNGNSHKISSHVASPSSSNGEPGEGLSEITCEREPVHWALLSNCIISPQHRVFCSKGFRPEAWKIRRSNETPCCDGSTYSKCRPRK